MCLDAGVASYIPPQILAVGDVAEGLLDDETDLIGHSR